MDFKVGDKVEVLTGTHSCRTTIEKEYGILTDRTSSKPTYCTDWYIKFYNEDDTLKDGSKWYCCETDIRLIKTNKNNMPKLNLIERARLLVKGEPEKSLVEKGVTNIDDTLTEDGKTLFNDFLYRSQKDAFVKDPAIAALLSEKDEDCK